MYELKHKQADSHTMPQRACVGSDTLNTSKAGAKDKYAYSGYAAKKNSPSQYQNVGAEAQGISSGVSAQFKKSGLCDSIKNHFLTSGRQNAGMYAPSTGEFKEMPSKTDTSCGAGILNASHGATIQFKRPGFHDSMKSHFARSRQQSAGIPARMKNELEEKSALSLDDVDVHFNSNEPERFGALAFTLGNQVFLGPGQERHLQHELGHVVQQKLGVVRPTGTVNGQAVNTDPGMESAADHSLTSLTSQAAQFSGTAHPVIQMKLGKISAKSKSSPKKFEFLNATIDAYNESKKKMNIIEKRLKKNPTAIPDKDSLEAEYEYLKKINFMYMKSIYQCLAEHADAGGLTKQEQKLQRELSKDLIFFNKHGIRDENQTSFEDSISDSLAQISKYKTGRALFQEIYNKRYATDIKQRRNMYIVGSSDFANPWQQASVEGLDLGDINQYEAAEVKRKKISEDPLQLARMSVGANSTILAPTAVYKKLLKSEIKKAYPSGVTTHHIEKQADVQLAHEMIHGIHTMNGMSLNAGITDLGDGYKKPDKDIVMEKIGVPMPNGSIVQDFKDQGTKDEEMVTTMIPNQDTGANPIEAIDHFTNMYVPEQREKAKRIYHINEAKLREEMGMMPLSSYAGKISEDDITSGRIDIAEANALSTTKNLTRKIAKVIDEKDKVSDSNRIPQDPEDPTLKLANKIVEEFTKKEKKQKRKR